MEMWQWILLAIPAIVLLLSVVMITRILLGGTSAAEQEPHDADPVPSRAAGDDEQTPFSRPADAEHDEDAVSSEAEGTDEPTEGDDHRLADLSQSEEVGHDEVDAEDETPRHQADEHDGHDGELDRELEETGGRSRSMAQRAAEA